MSLPLLMSKKSSFDILTYLTKRSEVDPNSGCWVWKNSCGSHGYGNAYRDGKFVLAHRLSYEHFKGEIPVGYQIDHLCFNQRCVNPDHLEAVTRYENLRRENVKRALSPCLHGHGIEHRYRRYSGVMICRACAKESKQRSKLKRLTIEENY